MSRITQTLIGAVAALTLVGTAVPAVAAVPAEPSVVSHGGYRTGDAPGEAQKPAPGQGAVKLAQAWQYNIAASCAGYEGAIEQGAAYWGGGTRTPSSGTPVHCVNGYVTICGAGAIVGCNVGSGQLIHLSLNIVNDFTLLAAHEFGHNWYGHSGEGCASWASPAEVMKTTMC